MREAEPAGSWDDRHLRECLDQVFETCHADPQVPLRAEILRLLGELEVYQRQLEAQNRQLRRVQQQLEAYRDRYVDLYDFAPLGYVTLDEEAYVQEINLAGARLLGLEREELTGFPLSNYVAPLDRPAFYGHLQECCGQRRETTTELTLVHREGRQIVVQLRSIPVETPEQEGTFCKTAVTDITQRKQAEEALLRDRNLLRTLIDTVPDYVYVKDMRGRFIAANRAVSQIMGAADPVELLGKTDADFYPPELAAEYGRDEREILRTGQAIINKDEPHRDAAGNVRALLTTKVPIFDVSGRVAAIVGVSRDFTDRKAAELELQRAKDAAEEANRSKNQFLANISHELRTPLGAILGMTELALEEVSDPAVRDYLAVAKDSADVLLALLNEILDFSRMEVGRFQLDNVPFHLPETLEQTLRSMGGRAKEKGLALRSELAPDLPERLIGDPLRLRQALVNLIGNAVKFTPQGQIVVSVAVGEHNAGEALLHFSVADTGIGISAADRQRIFTPFTQARAGAAENHGGTGLGLAITASLVSLMGGQIWVDSQPGQGSVFHFTARLKVPPPEPSGPGDATAATAIAPPAAPPTVAARPLRILLVDDSAANRTFVARILGKRGHNVTVVDNGTEAVQRVIHDALDVVLMDVQLPGLNGFEATAAIRALPDAARARLPIVAMTAHAMKGDDARCLAAGMTAYLAKPIASRELIELVERLAGGGSS